MRSRVHADQADTATDESTHQSGPESGTDSTDGVIGAIEAVERGRLLGWVSVPEGNKAPQLELLDDETWITRFVPNLPRPDLADTNLGPNVFGYSVRLPSGLADEREHRLHLRRADNLAPITGAERRLVLSSAPRPSAPGRRRTPSPPIPCSIEITGIEDGCLLGHIEPRSARPLRALILDLHIDGVVADQMQVVPPAGKTGITLPFRFRLPPRIRVNSRWTDVLDGESHNFELRFAGTEAAVAGRRLITPATVTGQTLIDGLDHDESKSLPRSAERLIERTASSALFDLEFYQERVGREFESKEQAIRHYFVASEHWSHPTAPWLDPDYLHCAMGEDAIGSISPVEWYLRQGADADIGPNPMFSNADFCLFSGRSKEAPQNATLFDEWLGAAATQPVRPSALIDPAYIDDAILGNAAYDGTTVLERLRSWLEQPPSERTPGALSPFFDQDWLEQCFVLWHHKPKGCLLSAFRLGLLEDQSPHPVLQFHRDGRDYYALIREYERLHAEYGLDEIARVCPVIDADHFYAQFPSTPEGTAAKPAGTSLSRYLRSDPTRARPSFLSDLDDEFIANELPGLIDHCTAEQGVADINRIWARWLRLLGVPGRYPDALRTGGKRLTLRDLNQLRDHRSPVDPHGITVSFIVPTYARDDLVLRCILSALQSGRLDNVEFLVAEDAAQVAAGWILGYFLPFAHIHCNPENLGFLRNCNTTADRARGDILLLVNNDVIVHKNAIGELCTTFDTRDDAAVVGGLILNLDGTIQENGGVLWRDGSAWNYHRTWNLAEEFAFNTREVDYVSGCWIGIRRSAWDRIGGFDPRYTPAYYEETDFCLSCRSNHLNVYINPQSVVTHLDGATMGNEEQDSSSLKSFQAVNRKKFREKWGPYLDDRFNEYSSPTPIHSGRKTSAKFISLIFDHYVPEPDRDAGSRSMMVVCQALAAVENNYVIFVPANNHRSDYATELEKLGIEVISGRNGWKRFNTLIEACPDLVRYVFVSRIGVATQFSWALDKLQCRKSIYIHDIEPLRQLPPNLAPSTKPKIIDTVMEQYAREHQGLFAKFDDIVSLSTEETELLRPYFAGKLVDIFPYEADFDPIELSDAQRTDLLFVGSYNHPPNEEAVSHFLGDLWPDIHRKIPEASLHLCGSGFENFDTSRFANVVLHGRVTDATLKYLYAKSRVSVAPLLSGAGMKGKVIESLSQGAPCIGTSIAYQGLTLPDAHLDLSGPVDTLSDRIIGYYNRDCTELRHEMQSIANTWSRENKISEVIPALMEKSKQPH